MSNLEVTQKSAPMASRYFQPWIGSGFSQSRTLLISESAYDWPGEDGNMYTPQPTHPQESMEWNIDHFGKNRYFSQINRVLCMKPAPTREEMQYAWQEQAYTIYVQESVGVMPSVRPKAAHWTDAGPHLLTLLEELRPLKVIITGRDAWNRMPGCSARLLDDIQAYRLQDGAFVWCLALPHPANRNEGFAWERIGESIRWFRSTQFPER
ncbi:uracil-DNA glycosylase family protein [Tunturiibacter gelidoferens]|uniref:Uracil-DNA glycosylase-like domain-containing protein n=1 Tax=Tunturiibacter gelidiferens TaxID=3069689 RepID=A0A9X0U3D7_9BACT|nr:uracil-DNA glycosylase family protein [Edaphobacter lichenicola]MBB5327805.1 hypothetical protein [Edaphobacter lichenicola]